MVGADSAAVAEARSAGRLRLESIDLADGREPHADLRPTAAGPWVLRRTDPPQSGLGPAGPSAVSVRSGGDQENAGTVPHPRDPGRRASQPAHQLQELRSETVLQRRPRLPHGGDLPEPEGLRREQGIIQFALSAENWP